MSSYLSKIGTKSLVFSMFLGIFGGISAWAASRDYLQYAPLSPFFGPYDPSRNYLRYQEPYWNWKPLNLPPTWSEIALYRQKLDTLQEVQQGGGVDSGNEMDPRYTVPDAGPIDASLLPPKMDLGLDPSKSGPLISPEVTISPWFTMPTPEALPPTADPQSQNQTPTPSDTPWIRKPVMGGSTDVYIPYSQTPGQNPPPASSALIYSQPDAGK
jgi:hypothetical protein